METVVLSERVNLEAVKYLMSMPKAWWKSVLSTDKNRKFDVEYKKAIDYLKGQLGRISLPMVRALGGNLHPSYGPPSGIKL